MRRPLEIVVLANASIHGAAAHWQSASRATLVAGVRQYDGVGKWLLGSTLLALAACSPPAAKLTEGAAQQAKMAKATASYADCIAQGAKTAPVTGEAAGSIANAVVLGCKEQRNALMADVIAFHQIGHPKFTINQSKAVAEASIATIEDELRQQTVVTIVQRQTAAPAKAS